MIVQCGYLCISKRIAVPALTLNSFRKLERSSPFELSLRTCLNFWFFDQTSVVMKLVQI